MSATTAQQTGHPEGHRKVTFYHDALAGSRLKTKLIIVTINYVNKATL